MHSIIKINAFFQHHSYFLKKQSTATPEVKYVFLAFPCFWEWLRSLCVAGPAKRTREATASEQLLRLPILLQLPCAHQHMVESCKESGSCSQSYNQWQFKLELNLDCIIHPNKLQLEAEGKKFLIGGEGEGRKKKK